MPAHRLNGNVPALNRVTRVAIAAELAAVNVRVAIRAFLANVREHQLDMALRTLHLFVHASQAIVRGVVIELRNAANGLPAQCCVAVFAGDVKPGSVGIPADLLLQLPRISNLGAELKTQKHNPNARNFPGHDNAPSRLPLWFVGCLTE